MNRCTNLEWDTPCVDECVDVTLNEDCKVLKLDILISFEHELYVIYTNIMFSSAEVHVNKYFLFASTLLQV